ncbi:MAG TPA: ribbon-helix-helix protein, CopG family [Gemmatimonadaceae bacterium]|nr:ribbon-helix-helix protein, CopG family [Gemmatimonadaceae bacterium]
MPAKRPFARIAITLPQETLRAADELAARHDRSRSWIVAEAVRQYAASQRREREEGDPASRVGPSRLEQLRRDLALSPEARVLESEELAAIGGDGPVSPPRTFSSYDDFLAWRRGRDAR